MGRIDACDTVGAPSTHNARASFCRSSLSRSGDSFRDLLHHHHYLDLHRYGRVRDLLYARTTFCCIAHETYQSWICVYSGCSTTCTAQSDRSLPEGAFFPGDDKHRLHRLEYVSLRIAFSGRTASLACATTTESSADDRSYHQTTHPPPYSIHIFLRVDPKAPFSHVSDKSTRRQRGVRSIEHR